MVDEEVRQYITEGGIKWQFITALALWQGGFYKRLVALVKRLLRKRNNLPILAKVEGIVNTRLLTYVYDEFNSGFTLTPVHFLVLLHFPLMMTSTDMDEADYNYYPVKDSATSLLEVWKKGQQQLNSFWDTWRNEYFLSLRKKSSLYRRSEKNQFASTPQVGKVVIIKDEKMPRCTVQITYNVNSPSVSHVCANAKTRVTSDHACTRM